MSIQQRRDVYSVSRLNREVRRLLESGLSMLWVEGEISNLATPASGHWYFSLKDAGAQIRCAMFRGRNHILKLRPQNGMKVIVRGKVSIYEPRGDYQFIAEHMREAGEGGLQLAYEQLKAKLAAEGLFDEARKKQLPAMPSRIGVITSPSGAAVRDILHVLARRFAGVPVRIYPVPVQGEQSAPAIVASLDLAAQRGDCDVLILTRGGGSLEDLWSFNEESVARAVASCPIPIVAAVGHETDVTICDFAADLRAPTPSAAAELVVPDARQLARTVSVAGARLDRALRAMLGGARNELRFLSARHRRCHPGQAVLQLAQRLDELDRRLRVGAAAVLQHRRQALGRALTLLRFNGPSRRLETMIRRTRTAGQNLELAIRNTLEHRHGRLAVAARGLQAVGPQATLDRGYAIVSRLPGGQIAMDAASLTMDERVHLRLARGSATATIDSTGDEDPKKSS